MRLAPILIGTGIIAIAAVMFFSQTDGPQPVAYAPAPAELLPPQVMGQLVPQVTTDATLPENGVQDWTFTATAGDTVTIRLLAANGMMALLPPDDIFPLAQASVGPATDEAQICVQFLAVAGTYTLQIQGDPTGPDTPFGPYSIRLEQPGLPCAQ